MPLAEVDDLAAFLGRDLTGPETGQATVLLGLATSAIALASGRTDEYIDTLDPAPRVLKAVALTVAARAMQNPAGARSESEQLGAYQWSRSYRDGSATGVLLTSDEERLVSMAVNGSGIATAFPGSIVPAPEPLISPSTGA